MTAPDDVRARFEASMREMWGDDDFNPARHPETPDAYRYIPEQSAWEGYRAAHADLSGEVRELVEAAEEMVGVYVAKYAMESGKTLGPLEFQFRALEAALAKFHPTHQEKP